LTILDSRFNKVSEITGYILAGGASSRMGSDKGALTIGDATFVEQIASALRRVTSHVLLVSSRHGAEQWGMPVVPDLRQGRGALGGIQAALSHAGTEWIAVVACDIPFVTAELFARLQTFLTSEVDAVAPVQPDGRIQPLCAFYRTGTCRPVANELLLQNQLRPRELLSRVRTRRVAFEELCDLKDASRFFLNINTPEEYSSIRDLGSKK
jgi:molybdopterin-guanine dinucleotide biosynthesis protein A